MFPGQRAHSSPGGWRRLRALSGFCFVFGRCRASLVGQDSSGKTLRARLKKKDSVNFERCLYGALGVGLEAHNQG
ncbi:hypothetical protein COP2_048126 [Malus domestica]